MKRIFLMSAVILILGAACKEKKQAPPPPPPAPKAEVVAEPQDTVEVAPVQEEVVYAEPVEPDKYFLISGSFQEYANAEKHQKELANQGFSSEIIHRQHGPNNEFYRVSYQSYSSWKEALNNLESERNTPGKEGVWLLVKK